MCMEERSIYYMACMEKMTPALYDRLIFTYGSAEAAWKEHNPCLPAEVLAEWDAKHAESNIRSMDDMKQEMERNKIRFLTREDPVYPASFHCLPDAPIGVFLRGRLPDPSEERVAVIGARKCSQYGKACASSLASDLATAGVWVISGMAQGIDAWAQWSALDAGGPSVAVLGSGIDVCYPASHRRLYETLIDRGGIISEYPPKVPGFSFHFPKRNRLISALSSVVVVVEAQKKSGTLITVDQALEQGKEVLAYPGRVDDIMSQGCLGLLRQGAGVCLGAQDVLMALGWSDERIRKTLGSVEVSVRKKSILSENEKRVYRALTVEPVHVDRLIELTGLSMGELMVDLWSLECKKLCCQSSFGMYQKR